jgi:hypothetical protein
MLHAILDGLITLHLDNHPGSPLNEPPLLVNPTSGHGSVLHLKSGTITWYYWSIAEGNTRGMHRYDVALTNGQ